MIGPELKAPPRRLTRFSSALMTLYSWARPLAESSTQWAIPDARVSTTPDPSASRKIACPLTDSNRRDPGFNRALHHLS